MSGPGAHVPQELIPKSTDATPGRGNASTASPTTGQHWLLARRSLEAPTDIAYLVCYTPNHVTLFTMALVAGARWAIKETLQTSKGETGLDHYQLRQYTRWYRHITLSMFAHAFLSVIRAHKGAHICPHPGSGTLVRLSLPEIGRLIVKIAWYNTPDSEHVLQCSNWRRRHQYPAQHYHYKARGRTLQRDCSTSHSQKTVVNSTSKGW